MPQEVVGETKKQDLEAKLVSVFGKKNNLRAVISTSEGRITVKSGDIIPLGVVQNVNSNFISINTSSGITKMYLGD